MNIRFNLIKIFLLLCYVVIFTSCCDNNCVKINEILQSYKAAVNHHDYDKIKPYLSNGFALEGVNYNASMIQFYAYINFKGSEKIRRIKLKKTEQINDSVITVYGKQYFVNGSKSYLVFTCQFVSDSLKILKLRNYLPVNYTLTTRASYINDVIFGNDRIENIKNLKIIDLSSGDSITGIHYSIYYDSLYLKSHAGTALQLFEKFDSILINHYGFYDVEREKLFLTHINTSNTCTVGNGRYIPWTMALCESDSINNRNLINKIGNTFSHEIVEGSLVVKYGLNDIRFRWFRDGLSEYIAYQFCALIAPKEAEDYFIKNRLSGAVKYKQNGNLLDWRGDTPIAELDTGKIYGDRFIYFDEVGQYGRAFKLFKDLFDHHPDQISEILHEIKLKDDISVDGLLKIMTRITDKNISELISEY